jgi:four helix bundle protein
VTSDEGNVVARDSVGVFPIRKFEDLVAWQRARELAADIYRVTNDGAFARDFGLREQSRRAAVSILSNIAEGHERAAPAEFHHFLSIAKGSCAELRAQLFVALDVGYLPLDAFERLLSQAEELGRIIGGLRTSVAKKIGKR